MGLDTTHDCWHGAYSSFMRWRREIARAAGLPPLDLMEGFYVKLDNRNLPTLWAGREAKENGYLKNLDEFLPISWECLKPDTLHVLLHHSDCDGTIPWQYCNGIARSLEKLLPKLPPGDAGGHIGNWRDKTQAFIDGLHRAAKARENVMFH